jgi:hypothetical protein
MADARGFGADVKLPVLAKLMLAERFIPRLFEQIATATAGEEKGVCRELRLLESAVAETDAKGAEAKRRATQDDDKGADAATEQNALLTEWTSSQEVCAWARVEPTLGDADLRPYFFIAKDKKDYPGPVSALGHLSSVADRLLAPKLAVQQLEPELRRLAPPEAARVFEALGTRILGSGDFKDEPQGVQGMTVLVSAHPELQNRLIDFIESLPADRCGAWVTSGWRSALASEAALSRFERVLEHWSRQTKNKTLKIAAGAILNMPRVRRA